MKKYKTREEIDYKDTWDLTPLFENDEAFLEELGLLEEKISLLQEYKGKLFNPKENLLETIQRLLQSSRSLENCYVYAHLKNDLDVRDAKYTEYLSKVQMVGVLLSSAASFFEPEILSLNEEDVRDYIHQQYPLYDHYIDSIFREKQHILEENEQKVLSSLSEVIGAPGNIFSMLNNADMRFGMVKNEKGEDSELTHGNYVLFLESKNQEVRKHAFQTMYEQYKQHNHSLAAMLQANVKAHVNIAKLRGYSSAREAALFGNKIPVSIYDNLITSVHEYLPAMGEYLKLRQEKLQLDKLNMYDVYVPLLEDVEYNISFDEAKQMVFEALKPLGEEYQNLLQKSFSERWIDVYETPGKRSGAYSSGSYDSYPYLLLNYQGNLDNVFTLAHELGHSMHSYYTRKNQEYVYGDYSIFLAEIASTFNESLMNFYLLEHEKDIRKRAFILNHFIDGIKGTLFRQTMFAEFERDIHEAVERGATLTSERLNNEYKALNNKYFCDMIEEDDYIQYEWSRIPHFYYNFYVYQYATGISAALALAKRVYQGQEGALEKYMSFLKAGSSKYPIEVLKNAGVDLEDGQVIREALDIFKEKVEELKELMIS